MGTQPGHERAHPRDQEATIESQMALLGTNAQHRAIRTLSGRAESTSRQRLREMSSIAAQWYARYLVQTANQLRSRNKRRRGGRSEMRLQLTAQTTT